MVALCNICIDGPAPLWRGACELISCLMRQLEELSSSLHWDGLDRLCRISLRHRVCPWPKSVSLCYEAHLIFLGFPCEIDRWRF